jgi:hypothetical protein
MTCGPMAKGYIMVSIPYPSSFLEPNKKTGITLSYNQIKNWDHPNQKTRIELPHPLYPRTKHNLIKYIHTTTSILKKMEFYIPVISHQMI